MNPRVAAKCAAKGALHGEPPPLARADDASRPDARLASPEALYAFSRVDRADFLDDDAVRARVAYLDEAVPLGRSGAQMSAPHIHAAALDLVVAHAKDPRTARDIGGGSGGFGALGARQASSRTASTAPCLHVVRSTRTRCPPQPSAGHA